MTAEHWIDLSCHPSRRPEAVQAIQTLVRRPSRGELEIAFRLDGEVSRVRMHAASAPQFADELWHHTCFEVFIAMAGRAAYHEFNFAPSGDWTVYAFQAYRIGSPLALGMTRPAISTRATENRLELNARVSLDSLSADHRRVSLRIGVSAVIATSDGLSYWALRHPAGNPDFHHDAGFALLLEPPNP